MSFFGFDKSMPHKSSKGDKISKELDFEDTYQGFGEHENEADDYLNSETFGNDADLGNDFDFGYGKSGLDVSESTYTNRSYVQPTISYVAATPQQHQKFFENVDLNPMESLWENQSKQQGIKGQDEHSIGLQGLIRQQPNQQQYPILQEGQIGMQNSHGSIRSSGRDISNDYGFSSQEYVGQAHPQYQYTPQCVPAQFSQELPSQFQQMPVILSTGQQQLPPQICQIDVAPTSPGFKGSETQPQHVQRDQIQQSFQSRPLQQLQTVLIASRQNASNSTGPHSLFTNQQAPLVQHGFPSSNFKQQYSSLPKPLKDFRRNPVRRHNESLSEEEQKLFYVRQAKVDKILKHSGVMTSRDKDFITRYQLSQIVTEDPYNEDFYFQVYKIIQHGGAFGESNKDLIARAYLEHSGHRLGGRNKRADVALQRMQSQVEKAVAVAKERPQRNRDLGSSKEGVLGKISSTINSRAPRRQLQIPTHKDDQSDSEEQYILSSTTLDELPHSLESLDINKSKPKRSLYISRSSDQDSVSDLSRDRKVVLSLIESIYEEVLELEAQLRNGKQPETTKLWEKLHQDDDLYEVSSFISILVFEKGVKIMPRIMNFLSKEQKMNLFSFFFTELSHLSIIVKSSYAKNPNPTELQLKKLEVFQSAFLKIIVSFLSSNADFNEVMSLLLCLIKNNNISFISTSKIALNLITVLISRIALLRQDITRSNNSLTTEISTWNELYDRLFTSLETKLLAVFPTKEYMDKIVAINNLQHYKNFGLIPNKILPTQNNLQFYDQSYIWQFFASLALSGKLNHQRIIIDEIRDEIFGTIARAEEFGKHSQDPIYVYQRDKMYQDLNLFLNVIGLVACDGEISELS